MIPLCSWSLCCNEKQVHSCIVVSGGEVLCRKIKYKIRVSERMWACLGSVVILDKVARKDLCKHVSFE